MCNPGPGERNYHIFYQMLAGVEDELRYELGFGSLTAYDYHYLNRSGCYTIDGVDDAQDYQEVLSSFASLDIEEKEVFDVLKLASSVLTLGNVSFQDIGDRQCEVTNANALQNAAFLLGVPTEDLGIALTQKSLKSVRPCWARWRSRSSIAMHRDAAVALPGSSHCVEYCRFPGNP